MNKTTIITDEDHHKVGLREGWEIDVRVARDDAGDPRIHVWIVTPTGDRIVLRYEKVEPEQQIAAVRAGWTQALDEIEQRRNQ